jgi:hypothetical protein
LDHRRRFQSPNAVRRAELAGMNKETKPTPGGHTPARSAARATACPRLVRGTPRRGGVALRARPQAWRRIITLRRMRGVARASARLAGVPVPARLWAVAAWLAEI